MRAVDTNILVRLIARDDERQTAAAETFVTGGAWVSHLVLVEAMCVLGSLYEQPSGKIATAVEILLAHRDLTMQEPDVVAAALDRFRERPKLGFSDCLILEVARRAGHLPLGTFDRDLAKIEGATKL